MRKNNKDILEVAKTLGYKDSALHRESMEEALNYSNKVFEKCPEEYQMMLQHSLQTVINTLTWGIAERVIKEDNNG